MNGYVKGFIGEAEAVLPTLRAEREELQARLATAEREPRPVALRSDLVRTT